MTYYLSVTSELRTRAIEHVEHQHDTGFLFWNVKHREAIEHAYELQRLNDRFFQL
jgi:hypothetical protein